MVEFIRHALGLCDEHWHPNIWTFLLGGLGLQQSFSYIKYKIITYGNKNKSRDTNVSTRR